MEISGFNQSYLKRKYKEYSELNNPQLRGRKFEDLILDIFKFSGFLAKKDQRSDLREQIDLIIQWSNFLALAELKWIDDPVSVATLQSFLWRIRQRGNMTIGIFISMSGFSEGALSEAKTQETSLLLFNKSDIEAIINNYISLDNLLSLKLWEIQKRKIIFWEDIVNESVELKQVIQLYTDDEKWCLNNGEVFSYQLNYHNEKRVSNSMIFTPELLIEGSYQKVSFLKWENRTNRPNANNKSINLFLELFNNLIGFSDDGVFSISNHGINWYGNTLNNMLSLVNQFNSKYSGLETEHLHHSEKIAYYDPLYLSYSVIFDIYLGGLDFNGEDDEYYIRWFEPFMLIPDKLKLSETYERINKISELGNFKIVEESVKIEKKYIFLENFSVKLTNLEPIYRKGYIIGAKIENPCNYNNELKSYLLTHFPLLVCEENWFVFLIDHLTEIDEEIFLKGIEYNKIKMYGSFLFLIRIEINW